MENVQGNLPQAASVVGYRSSHDVQDTVEQISGLRPDISGEDPDISATDTLFTFRLPVCLPNEAGTTRWANARLNSSAPPSAHVEHSNAVSASH